MDWTRLGRFFRLTGKLPGIHYDARVAVFDLQDAARQSVHPGIDRSDLSTNLNDLGAGAAVAPGGVEPRSDG